MSKNIILGAILASLLVTTYFLQEKRVENEHIQAELKDRVLNEPLKHLKWKGVDAEKKDEQWFMGPELLSFNIFKQIEKKLMGIKKVKSIEGEWSNFFHNPFEFEVNQEPWVIGEMTLDKQGFYLAIGKTIMVARIEGESRGLTKDEMEIEKIKVDELKAMLSKNLEDLKEKQLFRFYTHIPLEKVLIETQDRLSFELNFLSNATIPPPISGIAVHDDLKNKFLSLLTQVNIRKEISYDEKLKSQSMGKITFLTQDKESVVWELWLREKKSADAIIVDSKLKRAFLMVGGTLKIFFIGIQDYWDKKVIPAKNFEPFNRLRTKFYQGSKSANVTILNREPLQFECNDFKVQDDNMNELLSFVFNLGQRDQADRVSLLSKSERQQILNEDHLRMEVMGQDLLFWKKAEEIIVVNLAQGFKAHFSSLAEKMNFQFEDVLK